MGGELNKVGPTALPKRPARSCPAQPTIIQFIVCKLDKFTIYRCAQAAHIKKPAKAGIYVPEETKTGVQSRHWILPVPLQINDVEDRCQTFNSVAYDVK